MKLIDTLKEALSPELEQEEKRLIDRSRAIYKVLKKGIIKLNLDESYHEGLLKDVYTFEYDLGDTAVVKDVTPYTNKSTILLPEVKIICLNDSSLNRLNKNDWILKEVRHDIKQKFIKFQIFIEINPRSFNPIGDSKYEFKRTWPSKYRI